MYGSRLIRKLALRLLDEHGLGHHGTRPARGDCRQEVKNQNRQVATAPSSQPREIAEMLKNQEFAMHRRPRRFATVLANDRVHH